MIYHFVAWLVWLLATPFILIFSFKKKYRKSLPARFFLFKNSRFSPTDVQIHACSLGEVNAIIPLISNFENFSITTTTNTGFARAKEITPNSRFLPFENLIPFWLEKSKVVVIFEAELWLNFVKKAKRNGSFIILINARISDRSYDKYLKFKFYYKMVFAHIDLVLAQTQKDKQRLEILGAKNVVVAGNIKSANAIKPNKIYDKPPEKRMVVIASTHSGEEELILKNLKVGQNDKIILAPRHPERFEQTNKIFSAWAKEQNLSYEKFSQNFGLKSDCILLDALGELVNFYAVCDVVILGGSFVPNVGGHNPIEIAQFNVPIISGKFYFNQKALYELVKNIEICEVSEISQKINSAKKTEISQIFDMQNLINLIKEKI